jgi:hypothetical protein
MFESTRGISTDSINDGVFASTIQAGVLDTWRTIWTMPPLSGRLPKSTKPSGDLPQERALSEF